MSRFLPWLMVGGSLTLMGCILPVTPDFQVPPNTPPIVRGTETAPQREFRIYDRETAPATIEIDIEVEDPDTFQPLEYAVWVNHDITSTEERPVQNLFRALPAQPDSIEPEVRAVTIPLPRADLTRAGPLETGCRAVYVGVVEDYGNQEGNGALIPREGDAEGVGVWFIGLIDSTNPNVFLSDCPGAGVIMGDM